MYPQCFHIEITDSTGTKTPKGVKFPGPYKMDDPGFTFNETLGDTEYVLSHFPRSLLSCFYACTSTDVGGVDIPRPGAVLSPILALACTYCIYFVHKPHHLASYQVCQMFRCDMSAADDSKRTGRMSLLHGYHSISLNLAHTSSPVGFCFISTSIKNVTNIIAQSPPSAVSHPRIVFQRHHLPNPVGS